MRAGRSLRRTATFWRRSIQARVVVSVLVLTALVSFVIGYTLMRQISDGVVSAKVKSSVDLVVSETSDAQARLEAAAGTHIDANSQLSQLVSTVVQRGLAQGYDVLLTGPVLSTSTGAAEIRKSPGLDIKSVPTGLISTLQGADPPGIAWTYSSLVYDDQSGRTGTPAVVAGSLLHLPSTGDTYTLYFVFPLDHEQATVDLVRSSLITSGTLLLPLVAGVTWLVTRQVVRPVRLARRVAERLSAGRLEERMHVRGDDDIARLAGSFNAMAANLQRQIRQLEDMSASQRRFVADVSHELRTPLTTVRMAGDVLHDARARFDPATARAAELLQKELDRFEALLGDLLEISRFDAGAASLDLEDTNITDLVNRVVGSLAPLAEQRNVVTRVVAPQTPCVAEVDRRRVERIILNLVTNAIDYADSPEVVVRVRSTPDATGVAVRDFGLGLQPGDEIKVFNRFWRADPSRTRLTGGTGLGLSISREDAILHGGTLQAWGSPQRGAQFVLTLPRRAGDPITSEPLPLQPRDTGEPTLADVP
jgi:two-component system sensor histidine kinase MtrB